MRKREREEGERGMEDKGNNILEYVCITFIL
jgi:hypothetical protein